jgi:argininosuccinate lyase
MPHKKNPDVFELIRAKCNKIQALPYEIDHIGGNLFSGYFRDMQIIKESFLPVFSDLRECISMFAHALTGLIPAADILDDNKYQYIFSVEEVNKLVLEGLPFRDAYKIIAGKISDGSYKPDRHLRHSHEGSMGNLCNDKIVTKMESVLQLFHFERKDRAYENLLKSP